MDISRVFPLPSPRHPPEPASLASCLSPADFTSTSSYSHPSWWAGISLDNSIQKMEVIWLPVSLSLHVTLLLKVLEGGTFGHFMPTLFFWRIFWIISILLNILLSKCSFSPSQIRIVKVWDVFWWKEIRLFPLYYIPRKWSRLILIWISQNTTLNHTSSPAVRAPWHLNSKMFLSTKLFVFLCQIITHNIISGENWTFPIGLIWFGGV